jgi:hypothetical protein
VVVHDEMSLLVYHEIYLVELVLVAVLVLVSAEELVVVHHEIYLVVVHHEMPNSLCLEELVLVLLAVAVLVHHEIPNSLCLAELVLVLVREVFLADYELPTLLCSEDYELRKASGPQEGLGPPDCR